MEIAENSEITEQWNTLFYEFLPARCISMLSFEAVHVKVQNRPEHRVSIS